MSFIRFFILAQLIAHFCQALFNQKIEHGIYPDLNNPFIGNGMVAENDLFNNSI